MGNFDTQPGRDTIGRLVWDMWVKGLPHRVVHAELTARGLINLNTGKPFTFQGTYYLMWRWVSKNIPEAKKMFLDNGRMEKEFYTRLLRWAHNRKNMSARTFELFIYRNDLKPLAQELGYL